MADTATLHKKPMFHGEQQNVVEVYSSSSGSVVVNRQPIYRIYINKDLYDSLTAGQKTAVNGLTVSQLIAAAYGTSEI